MDFRFRSGRVCLERVPLHVLLIIVLAVTLLPDPGRAVRMMGVESVDHVKYVVEGDNVTFDCNYDLEGEQLYTLLWWKDDQMLLRYLPGEYNDRKREDTLEEPQEEEGEVEERPRNLLEEDNEEEEGEGGVAGEENTELTSLTSPEMGPPLQVVTWFDQAGVKAFVQRDPVPRRLLLLEVHLNASGNYVCEVTTEAPTYYTVRSTTTLHVMVPPRTDPKLEGPQGVVVEGTNVQATCTSSPSLPTPTVTFWINDKSVMEEYMSPPSVSTTDAGEIEVRRSVEFQAHRGVFDKGVLLLQCRVTLHDLVWNSTSKLLLENYDGTSGGGMQVSLGTPSAFRNLLVTLLFLLIFLRLFDASRQ
ncbi:uncharacterized protein LOC143035833 [Oratosquilla oratoria]|uniref:uncharacterized protein LOC143035833 n=1 Tax=Oratosquilla oratoria TaxID=337810 RepID=UPI003F75E6E8